MSLIQSKSISIGVLCMVVRAVFITASGGSSTAKPEFSTKCAQIKFLMLAKLVEAPDQYCAMGTYKQTTNSFLSDS
jgi:hypothetical protein